MKMKRIISVAICVCLLLSMAVAFGGCEKGQNKEAIAVEAYVDSFKDEAAEQASNSILTCEVEARETKVVYKYYYTSIDETSKEIEDALEEQLEAYHEAIKDVLEGLQGECSEVTAVVYEYYTSDKELIISYEVAE